MRISGKRSAEKVVFVFFLEREQRQKSLRSLFLLHPTRLYPIEEPFGVNENNSESGVNENKKTGSMVSAICES